MGRGKGKERIGNMEGEEGGRERRERVGVGRRREDEKGRESKGECSGRGRKGMERRAGLGFLFRGPRVPSYATEAAQWIEAYLMASLFFSRTVIPENKN